MTDISALEAYAGTISEAAAKANTASQKQHAYVNGDSNSDVLTESGPVPTIAKQAKIYLETLPDAVADLSKQVANGRVYGSVSEGIAAVADGAQFWVRQAAPLNGQDLYKRVGSSATWEGVGIAGSAQVDALSARVTATGVLKVPKGPLRNAWGVQVGTRLPIRIDDEGNAQMRVGTAQMARRIPSSPANPRPGAGVGLVVGRDILANPANMGRALKRPRGPSLSDPLVIVAGNTVINSVGQQTAAALIESATAAVTRLQLASALSGAWDDLSWIVREVVEGGKSRVQVHDGSAWRALIGAMDDFTYAAPVAKGSTVRFLSDRTTGVGGALTPHAQLKSGELVPEAPVLWHRQGTGQSLSIGSRGFVIGSDGAPKFEPGVSGMVFSWAPSAFTSRCLTFKGYSPRVYTGGVQPVNLSAVTDFTPLFERFEEGLLGETPMSGFANAMNRYLFERGTGMSYLCSISGVGGTAYSGLKKGTNTFTSLVNALAAAKRIADARGMIYRVGPLSITHGESEPVGTSEATYAGYMREWLSDYQAAVAAVVPGQPAPWCYMSQMNRGGMDLNFVTLAQLQMHESDAQFVLVSPKYQYRYYDVWHPFAEAYFKTGEYEARAERFRLRGQKFDCLRPLTAVCTGTTLLLTLSNAPDGNGNTAGPIGRLQVSPQVSAPANYGFALTDSATSITAVDLLPSGNQVRLTLSAQPPAGSSVTHALTAVSAARGCITDTDTRDLSGFDGLPLSNWLVAFSKPITFN